MPAVVCAVLTPPGKGAIATIAVSGDNAIAFVSRRFQPAAQRPLTTFAVGSVVLGRFHSLAGPPEELVVGLPSPHQVEVHCHGGRAAVAAICEALANDGIPLVKPEVLARQLQPDALRAAAWVALGNAKTAPTASILLDQYHGALSAAVTAILEHLDREEFEAAHRQVEDLLRLAPAGVHLTVPWKVVLAGPPNAGKSSLMNAVLGYERSIVYPEPGTTRDVLSALTAIEGWPMEFVDTAGLRETTDALETAGVGQARRQWQQADLVLFVSDLTTPFDFALYSEVCALCERAPRAARPLVQLVHNKADLGSVAPSDRPVGLAVSAHTGVGLVALCHKVYRLLIPVPLPRSQGVPFLAEQVQVLQDVAACLTAGDRTAARQLLSHHLLGNAHPPP